MGNTKNTKTGKTATKTAGVVAVSMTREAVEAIVKAFGTSDETELSRLAIVESFAIKGLSIRQAVASAVKANGGKPIRGFSVPTVGRYAAIVSILTGDDMRAVRVTDAQYRRIALALVNLTNNVQVSETRERVAAILSGKPTGARLAQGIEREAAEASRATYKALVAPRKAGNRPTGGETADGGKAPKTGDKGDGKAETVGTVDRAAALALASTSELLAALLPKVKGKAFTIKADDLEAFTALAEAVERAVAADRIAR